MYQIPTLLTADELLDKAFKKAGKKFCDDRDKFYRIRKLNQAKMDSVAATIDEALKRYIKAFPSIENLPPFYKEIVDITIDGQKIKSALAGLSWCRSNVTRVCSSYSRSIDRCQNLAGIDRYLKAGYGRVSSLVKQIDPNLKFLIKARKKMNELPWVNPDSPAVVVAGLPNAGKSQLVRAMSTGKPQVAAYPFTTKKVSVGHFEHRRKVFQVMDTPGLLDRQDRNVIELQAIAGLRHLADVIIVVMDFNEHSGFDTDQQTGFFSSIKTEFGKVPVIAVENKVDIGLEYTKDPRYQVFLDANGITEPIRVSGATHQGVEDLQNLLVKMLKEIKNPDGVEEEPKPERNRKIAKEWG